MRMEELQSLIVECQNNLYKGFVSTENGLEWLNDACGQFHKLFQHLHKFLIFDGCNYSHIIENCFLCASQILCCIKYLEKALNEETKAKIVMTSSRQFFLDRSLWCLAKLKSILSSVDDNVIDSNTSEINFITYMDTALEMIAPLTINDSDTIVSNVAAQNAEIMIESTKIRQVIDTIISQTLAFTNVTIEEDRKSLIANCQKVLKECIEFENETSLANPEKIPNVQERRLKALSLENALYQLETVVNNCLLRLIYRVFSDIAKNPLNILRNATDPDEIDNLTNDFDLITDRLMQVGLFAISYSSSMKSTSAIRSCLASLESLDSALIPSIFSNSNCEYHSRLLEMHWIEELGVVQGEIQQIIDSNAFFTSLISTFDDSIRDLMKNFDKSIAENIVDYVDVLQAHLEINSKALKLKDEKTSNLLYGDFKLMVIECRAALFYSNKTDVSRIVKRLKILLNCIKKLQRSLFAVDKENVEKESVKDEVIAESFKKEFFESFNIKASVSSILYKTRRNSMRQPAEEFKTPSKLIVKTLSSRKGKKRNSLRVAMFKKSQIQQTEEYSNKLHMQEEPTNDTSMDLHITDILEQLTDLSSTLSHHTTIAEPQSQNQDHYHQHQSNVDNVTSTMDHKLRINIRM